MTDTSLQSKRTLPPVTPPSFVPVDYLLSCINAATALEKFHRKGKAHLGIRPKLLRVHEKTGRFRLAPCSLFMNQGKLTDPSLPNRPLSMDDPGLTETILPYMAPEQTGRVPWPVDFACDLYSLGILFYEWACGSPPFQAKDLLEYFHCHIARDPASPREINNQIPDQISDIILKLIEKSPADRYQSCGGLKRDLEKCLEMIHGGESMEPFLLGEKDVYSSFRLSSRFYNRTRELASLSRQFETVRQGRGRAVLVSGVSGMGKTRLVFEFIRQNFKDQESSCEFIQGKFERLARNRPYSAFIQAIHRWTEQVLSRENESVTFWKSLLSSCMKRHGDLILYMVPGLAGLLGSRHQEPNLSGTAPRNRFVTAMAELLSALCPPGRQLILFLDDLQWADRASRDLLKNLIEKEIPGLFMISAFRSNEKDSDHLLADLTRGPSESLTHILVSPLDSEDVKMLIFDSTRMDQGQAVDLAGMVLERTRGNPFDILEYLSSLEQEGLVFFRHQTWEWSYDAKKIKSRDIGDDFSLWMSRRADRITRFQKRLLNMGSCLPAPFSAKDFSLVAPEQEPEIEAALVSMTEVSLLNRVNQDWQFSHDKIRDRIYNAMDVREREELHFNLGTAMLAQENRDERIFEILVHLNSCPGISFSQDLRFKLASLNLTAGIRSKKQVAFAAAFSFAQKGLECLSPEGGAEPLETGSRLIRDLHLLAGETGHAAGERSLADRSLLTVKTLAPDMETIIRAHEIEMSNLMIEGDIKGALASGRQALGLLGMKIPKKTTPGSILKELVLSRIHLLGRTPEELAGMPRLADPEKILITRILSKLFEAGFLGAPEILPLVVLKTLNLTLAHGESELSGYAYAVYGAVLCDKFKKIDRGYRFGKLALKVHEQEYNQRHKPCTYFIFGGMINHWKNHLKTNAPYLLEAVWSGMRNGTDLIFASESLDMYLSGLMIAGRPLPKVYDTFMAHRKNIDAVKPFSLLNGFDICLQSLDNLMGKADDPYTLAGRFYDETLELPEMIKREDPRLPFYYIMKLINGYLLNDFKTAFDCGSQATGFIDKSLGSSAIPMFCYFHSLSMAALFHRAGKKRKKKLLSQITKYEKKLRPIARHSPHNYLSMHALVRAEYYGLKNQRLKAARFYEQAIASARENKFLHLEAIAWECAARHFARAGQNHLASSHMAGAYRTFHQWGAIAKVQQMEEEFPDLFESLADPLSRLPGKKRKTPPAEPDLISMIKASQSIAREKDIRALMKTLMNIVIENAGADHGFLILDRDGETMVEAEATAGKGLGDSSVPIKLCRCNDFPRQIVLECIGSGKPVTIQDAAEDERYTLHPSIRKNRVRSVLCLPLVHRGQTTGAFYLENRKAPHVFTGERVIILNMVADILTNALSREKAREELKIYQEKLRALSSRIALTQEEERRTIAKGLHDHIGHSLVLAKMKLTRAGQAHPETSKELKQITGIIDQAMVRARDLTFELSSPELYEFGIEAALDALCERKSLLYDLPISFFDDEQPKPLTQTMGILIYQAVRELIFNAVKHARASRITVSVKRNAGRVQVFVEDNGIGFEASPMEDYGRSSHGYGLFSIREKMGPHKGSFSIESTPGKGTMAVLSAPLKIHPGN